MPGTRFLLTGLLMLALAALSRAAELKIVLPQGRSAFQTNEWIDVTVLRSDTGALPGGTLNLTLAGKDASKVAAAFAVPAVAVQNGSARATEHYHLNGWLLRPGSYTIEASYDGATGSAPLEIYSHVRQSSFKLINWGRAKGKDQQLQQGENGLGFNTFYGHYGQDEDGSFIRAGVDYIANCTMGGAHQMDIRLECDWSDPYVTKGGTSRVVRRAMIDRTRPNVPGVHFYDEPGLTWRPDGKGGMTPHMIPSQVRSYVAAFGKEPLPPEKLDPKNAEHVKAWKHWATWKLGFMDAAWKESQFGVSQVRPDYLSLTQSQYGWSAFVDGYYFNVARSLPITSGHGGYHDFGPGFFNPSFFLEMARARDFAKPCWYLPTWYGNTTADQFRMEQYLSFQTHLQGMMAPPDCEPAVNAVPRQGIVESNMLMKKLGPVFTTTSVTKPPVALLFSLSNCIQGQVQDVHKNLYVHNLPHGHTLPLAYLSGRLIQQPFLTVLDEDVVDGTLASDHKAVVLTAIDYLDPDVVKALEGFIEQGGLVLLTADCTVAIKGATKLAVKAAMPDQEIIDKLHQDKKYDQTGPYTTTAKHIEGATPLAKAIKAELDKKGIKPVLETDVPSIIATRQAAGDIEYLFAVNGTPDAAAKDAKGNPEKNATKATAATISLAADGRPIYDAVVGGPVPEFQSGPKGNFRFGPGQMRVFARTARPLGGVMVLAPVVTRELTKTESPITLEIAAALVDSKGVVLSGAAPLHIQVIDPLGSIRHELYRATKLGQVNIAVPLAANDPPGQWKVVVRELLNNGEDTATFNYVPPVRARSIAGATPRAVYAVDDRDKAFRFARLFHDVTIVKGKSPYHDAAAERLAKSLKPFDITCKTVNAADIKPREISDEDAAFTWCGMEPGRVRPKLPADLADLHKQGADAFIKKFDANGDGTLTKEECPPFLARYFERFDVNNRKKLDKGDINALTQPNNPAVVGFDVRGPVILLGTPEDNPVIAFLQKSRFLPYTPSPDFPGRGRGLIAWQRDGVGRGQESITLIGYDEAGLSEAVGSFYEAVAGLEPLTKWDLPQSDTLTPAKTAPDAHPAAVVAWSATLPDRVVGLKATDAGLTALSHDGSLATLTQGKVSATKPAAEYEQSRKELATPAPAADQTKAHARPDRMVKFVAANGGQTAVAYWGGTLRIVDDKGAIKAEQQLPQDVTALTWHDGKVIAGLADGRVLALTVK